jgi:CRP-like cAMP-binding protein
MHHAPTAPPSRTAFLDRLDDVDRAALIDVARARVYPSGSIMFFETDPPDSVLLVRSGLVKLAATVGDQEVVLDVIGPRDVVGELSALDGSTRLATASALTRVEVSAVRAGDFRRLVNERPAMALAILGTVADRLRAASRRQVEYGALDAIGRVCRRVVELGERFGTRHGDTIEIVAPLTQSQIAAWAGLSREAVVKALGALRRLGWVRTVPGALLVDDLSAVRARAGIVP